MKNTLKQEERGNEEMTNDEDCITPPCGQSRSTSLDTLIFQRSRESSLPHLKKLPSTEPRNRRHSESAKGDAEKMAGNLTARRSQHRSFSNFMGSRRPRNNKSLNMLTQLAPVPETTTTSMAKIATIKAHLVIKANERQEKLKDEASLQSPLPFDRRYSLASTMRASKISCKGSRSMQNINSYRLPPVTLEPKKEPSVLDARTRWFWAFRIICHKNSLVREIGNPVAKSAFVSGDGDDHVTNFCDNFYETLHSERVRQIVSVSSEIRRFLTHKNRQDLSAEDRERLVQCLRLIPGFGKFDPAVQNHFLDTIEYSVHSRGTDVIKTGHLPLHIYFLLSGECDVYSLVKDPTTNRTLKVQGGYVKAGESFGLVNIVQKSTSRDKNVVCSVRTELLRVNLSEYFQFMELKDSEELSHRTAFLSAVPILHALCDAAIDKIAAACTKVLFLNNQIIVRESEPVTDVFFLVQGRCRAVKVLYFDEVTISQPTAKVEKTKLIPVIDQLSSTNRKSQSWSPVKLKSQAWCLNGSIKKYQFFPEFTDFPIFQLEKHVDPDRVLMNMISEVICRKEETKHYSTIIASSKTTLLSIPRWKLLRLLNPAAIRFILDPKESRPRSTHGASQADRELVMEEFEQRIELYPGLGYINTPLDKLQDLSIDRHAWEYVARDYQQQIFEKKRLEVAK